MNMRALGRVLFPPYNMDGKRGKMGQQHIHICDRIWEKGPYRANNDFSV